jgi:hypothetical protein
MSKVKMNDNRIKWVKSVREILGDVKTIDRADINSVVEQTGMNFPYWQVQNNLKESRGNYFVPSLDGKIDGKTIVTSVAKSTGLDSYTRKNQAVEIPDIGMAPSVMGVMEDQDSYIPEKFLGYVPWGNFNTVKDIVKSNIFYPMFITGLSGNGKTLMVKEVCAKLKREFIRANITVETDEDDLIGGFRLLNGETVWHDGPVVTAMKRGAVLLLDEIDLASNKIMALQPVLEGSSIYLKKIGKWVHPAEGFTVIATANTKGQGSDDGRFIGTNVLNEAFLERFPVTIEQSYPTAKMETKILDNELGKHGIEDAEFSTNLVKWADVIRKTFYEGGVDEIISTRRLVHIVGAFSIFKDKSKAIELTVNRFDIETKESFLDLYSKIDGGVDPDTLTGNQDNEDNEADDDIIDPPF